MASEITMRHFLLCGILVVIFFMNLSYVVTELIKVFLSAIKYFTILFFLAQISVGGLGPLKH